MAGSPHRGPGKEENVSTQAPPPRGQGQWLLDSVTLADGAVRSTQAARRGG